ncbi:hypothetical protein OE88DRAFT_1537795 [Heliocybe sulcata]|uniref:Uncharacterized protein n=1 Tax=Heliocybe sulcata TaxID=5364 RepID=A0A5C3N157_9AGAM|nr:hypothetical protein OE88DRAFT_1537795 [Heliocybe sulcata]
MADSTSNRTARTPAEGETTIQRPASLYLSRSNPADAPLELALADPPHSRGRSADAAPYTTPAWTQPSSSSAPDTSARSAGTMIPPTASFYDPDQAVQHEGQDYQRWLDAYAQGQMQYGTNVPSQLPASAYPTGADMHPPIHHPAPQMQNQYHYVQSQHYAPAPSHGFDQAQYQRRGTIRGPNVVSGMPTTNPLDGAIPYQPEYQTPNRSPNEPGIYFQINNDFNFTSDNPQPQTHYPSSTQHTPDPMSASTNYTPSSSYADLHQSSVSPPGSGWPEDVPPSRPAPSASGRPQISTTAGAPRSERIRAAPANATGKRERPSAAGRGRKRTRKEGEGANESDSSSDDEAGAAGGGGGGGRSTRLIRVHSDSLEVSWPGSIFGPACGVKLQPTHLPMRGGLNLALPLMARTAFAPNAEGGLHRLGRFVSPRAGVTLAPGCDPLSPAFRFAITLISWIY